MTSRAKIPRKNVIDFVDKLKAAAHVQVIHIDAATDAEAWQLLKSRQDKEWSVVD